ncbi:hypothetical protein FOZ60_012708 [Perkinsus olseni]|uniref:CW-type domain-containing protein n=1 Tax=Perkinsus olseni TaxID=32597 RepID=A0A7J6NAX9_PEROL|nr:hypothetical protein FOZ60_012708 [Perkinsus olseni]
MSLRSTQPIVLQVEPLFREVRYYFVLIVILSGTTILQSVLWLRLAAAAMVAVYAIYALTLTKEASCSDEEDPLLLLPDGRHLDDSAGSTCSGCTAVSHVTISGLSDLPGDDNGTVMAVASFVAWPVDASLNSISPMANPAHQWLGCIVSVVWMSTSAFIITRVVDGWVTGHPGFVAMFVVSLTAELPDISNALRLANRFGTPESGGSSAQTPDGPSTSLSSPEGSAAVAREILTWVQCDKCKKWRRISSAEHLPQRWFCSLNPNPRYNSCDIPAEPESMDMAYTPDSETAQGSPSPFTAASSTPKTEPVAAAATPSRVDWPELLELFRRTPREEPEAAPGWAVPPKKLPRRGEAQARADSLHAAAQKYLPPHVARECPAPISMYDRQMQARRMTRESEARLEAARDRCRLRSRGKISNQHYRYSMSLGTVDAQKDEFRKYLEKTGVVSQLTRTPTPHHHLTV